MRSAMGSASACASHYSDEGDAALETGGGVFKALPLLGLGAGPFLVVSGDVWTDYPLSPRAVTSLSPADVAHFVLVPNPDISRAR